MLVKYIMMDCMKIMIDFFSFSLSSVSPLDIFVNCQWSNWSVTDSLIELITYTCVDMWGTEYKNELFQ